MKIITDQIQLNLPIPIDTKLSNLVLSGETLVVESISDYLNRVDIDNRHLGMEVIVYSPPGNYNINLIKDSISSGFITQSVYTFLKGIANKDFVKLASGSTIVDNLTSTEATDVLSANMGRVLKDMIEEDSSITNVTYDELMTLIDTNSLTPEASYKLIDYQTVHYMFDHYTRLDDINTGPIEPLTIKAATINSIYPEAKSELYPQDDIWYDPTTFYWMQDIAFANAENVYGTVINPDFTNVQLINGYKGVIYDRFDRKNNVRVGYDFRNVKSRRWAVAAQLLGFNTEYTCYNSIGSNGQTVPDPMDYMDFYTFQGFDEWNTYEVSVKNIIIENAHDTYTKYGGDLGSTLSNNVFFLGGNTETRVDITTNDISAGIYFEVNTIGVGNQYNTFGHNCCQNLLGKDGSGNTFGNNCKSIIFESLYTANKFGNDCYFNTFGYNCHTNNFENRCSYNIFKNHAQLNNFGYYCQSNTFGNYCSENTLGANCSYNKFDHDCNATMFGTNCTANTFGYNCDSNTFGDSCNLNTLGNSCSINFFRINTISNTLGDKCEGNTFVDNMYFNNITNTANVLFTLVPAIVIPDIVTHYANSSYVSYFDSITHQVIYVTPKINTSI